MNIAEALTVDLRAELRYRRARLETAGGAGSPATAELERGIRPLEGELRRRERYAPVAKPDLDGYSGFAR